MKLNLFGGAIALALSCHLVQAKDSALPNHALSEWSVGETLFGAEAKLDSLKGQVVVIEYWAAG